MLEIRCRAPGPNLQIVTEFLCVFPVDTFCRATNLWIFCLIALLGRDLDTHRFLYCTFLAISCHAQFLGEYGAFTLSTQPKETVEESVFII